MLKMYKLSSLLVLGAFAVTQAVAQEKVTIYSAAS